MSGSGSGSTLTTYYLYNGTANVGNTNVQTTMPFDRQSAPTSTTVWDYSQDLHTAGLTAGRRVNAVSTASASNGSVVTEAEWRHTVTGASTFKGSGVLTLYALPVGTVSGTLAVFVSQVTPSGTVTQLTSSTVAANWSGCSGYQQFQLPLDFAGNGSKLNANDSLSVKVEYVGSGAVDLAYDTTSATGFMATAVLPVKSGG